MAKPETKVTFNPIEGCDLEGVIYDNKCMTYTAQSTALYLYQGAVIELVQGKAYTFKEIEALARKARKQK